MSMYIDNNYKVDISRGVVPGVEQNFKFGAGPITTSLTTVWVGAAIQPGLYVRPQDAGEIIYISSSSANDVMTTGSGAWSILIDGIGVDFVRQQEIVELNGHTQVPSTKLWVRICRTFVYEAASDSGCEGMLYCATSGASAGVPTGTIYQYIQDSNLDKNQSQTSCFTVPKGYSMYIL